MKVTYWVASSLDGFIATADGGVSWLEGLGISMQETGYEEFYGTVDALVMGRTTYEQVCGFGAWPYGNKPCWVCSSGNVLPVDGCNLQGETSPLKVVESAKAMKVEHLWLVGGGRLAASFIEQSLLTDISVSQMPIILGDGINLFGPMKNPVLIKPKGCKHLDAGFVQVEYSVGKPGAEGISASVPSI